MNHLDNLITRYPQLASVRTSINDAAEIMIRAFSHGGKLLVAGNGGSAADCDHIVGELMKSFAKQRPLPESFVKNLRSLCDADMADFLTGHLQKSLPAIALTNHVALNTASMNDVNAEITFAQQVMGYGEWGDVFLGISTSGNSRNVLCAVITAKTKGLPTILLTGGTGGEIASLVDVAIIVPETETYKIQELHLPVYHCLCLMIEEHFFG